MPDLERHDTDRIDVEEIRRLLALHGDVYDPGDEPADGPPSE